MKENPTSCFRQLPGVPHCSSPVLLSVAFQAFSAFYYNFKFLNLTEGQPLAVVRQAIEGLCTRSWEDVRSSGWRLCGIFRSKGILGWGEGVGTPPGQGSQVLSCVLHSRATSELCGELGLSCLHSLLVHPWEKGR